METKMNSSNTIFKKTTQYILAEYVEASKILMQKADLEHWLIQVKSSYF